MKALLTRTLEVGFILALVYLLAGCSALSGLGKDITWIGDLEPPAQQQN